MGDSKTQGEFCCTGAGGYRAALAAAVPRGVDYTGVDAANGKTVNLLKTGVDAFITTVSMRPDFVLLNIGANDFFLGTGSAAYQSDLAYTLDAAHVAWPFARILVAKPWRRTYDTESDTMAGWIDTVLATRGPWAAVGIDERATPGLKNGDDGVTYTTDGIHPNAPGYALVATQWQAVLGY